MRVTQLFLLIGALTIQALPQTVRILFDGSMTGHLTGCPCTSAPKSGLVKRAAFIHEYRKAHPGEVLVVSTGDFLEFGVDEKFAKAMLDGVASVGYDAIALGDQEFLAGLDFAERSAKRTPLLSVNLSIDGWLSDTRFPASVVKEAGGLRTAFIALTGANVFRFFPDKKLKEKLIVSDPLVAVKAELSRLAGKADLFVLLSHQGLEADQALAKSLAGSEVNLLLGGHSQDLTSKPLVVGGIPILHPGPSGNWQVECLLTRKAGKVTLQKVRYHFFKYPNAARPVSREVILGTTPWGYEPVIHENPVDDPAVAQIIKELGS